MTMFKHRVVYYCTWYKTTLDQRLMINIVIFLIRHAALYLGHSKEERNRAVSGSSDGEMYLVGGEAVRQTW